MRPSSSLLAVLALALAPAAISAQGRIIPRPCPLPPPCREGPCPMPMPCPRPGPAFLERTSSQVRVQLVDRVLRYEVTETFRNHGGFLAEADYMFPLPKDAAFQDLALNIDGELVAGETLNATEARRIYEDIVRKSRDPALVEWMGRGLLRTRIFPIQPGEEKKVVVRFQAVAEREGNAFRIDYTRATDPNRGMPGPRPDVPMRDDRTRPTLRGESTNAFVLTYPLGETFGEPYSPTHTLRTSDRNGRRSVEASGDGSQVTILLPMRRPNAASVTMLPYAPGRENGFALITVSPPAGNARPQPRDVTFVVDVSGSMSGRKMDQARAAGRQILNTLNERDHFRIIDFSTDVRSFRDDFVPATRANLAAAERYVDALRAEGSTNISGALTDALDVRTASDRVPVVIFVTDGEPTVGERSADAIAAMAARLRGRARVFTVGVGADVNTPLVEQLAVDGRGTAQFLRPDESVERAVGLVAGRLTSPVLTDVRIHAEGVRLLNVHPILPADIFAGQDLVLFARYEGNGDARIVVEGRTADGPVSWTERVRFPERDRENTFVARLWASQRIGWLATEKRRNGGNAEVDNEIRDLGTRFGIPTEFSSYLVLEPGMRVDSLRRASLRDQAASTALQQVVVTGATGQAMPAPAAMRAKEEDFERAKTASAQREVKSLAVMDSISRARPTAANADKDARNERRSAGDRTFALRDGVWTDTRAATPGVRTVKIKAYSAAYFAILSELDELRAPFALGDRVLVSGRKVAIEVSADGVEQLSARELTAISTDW